MCWPRRNGDGVYKKIRGEFINKWGSNHQFSWGCLAFSCIVSHQFRWAPIKMLILGYDEMSLKVLDVGWNQRFFARVLWQFYSSWGLSIPWKNARFYESEAKISAGWWLSHPSEKIWVRQLGWWLIIQKIWKSIKNMFQTTNQSGLKPLNPPTFPPRSPRGSSHLVPPRPVAAAVRRLPPEQIPRRSRAGPGSREWRLLGWWWIV